MTKSIKEVEHMEKGAEVENLKYLLSSKENSITTIRIYTNTSHN